MNVKGIDFPKFSRLINIFKIKINDALRNILKKVKAKPVYRVTEKYLSDTIKDCYKQGLSDAQILEVLNTPPYKWNSTINSLVDYNREQLNDIFEVKDYGENYDSYNMYDVYNSLDNTCNEEISLYLESQSQSLNTKMDDNELELISYLITDFCCSSEFLQAICAKYPQYAEKIIAYIDLNNIVPFSISKNDYNINDLKDLQLVKSARSEDYELLKNAVLNGINSDSEKMINKNLKSMN